MRYSNLFGKTVRDVSAEVSTQGHRFLHRAGFIRESSAGRYYLLPLGIRVQDKICRVVEQEMDRLGAQKMVAPILHPLALWEETKRDQACSFELLKVEDRRGATFVLGGTAEEMMVALVRQFDLSYRDLPFVIYQFSQKFRDELRARGGLLRTREFLMKDAYSFHAGEADFKAFYQRATEAYQRIFKGLSLKTVISQADNGYMGGEYCHEFLVQHETGETYYRFGDDGTAQSCTAEAGDGVLRGIEVGNIFQLGTYYSERMRDATYVGANGIREPLYMGCYGIGIGRTLAAIAELHCDENGLVWPEAVAPYQCHLMCLGEEASERDAAERLYQELLDNGIEVLFDDRSVSAGVKFADADLIGIPKRVLVSKRTMQQSKVEYKERQDRQSKLMEFSQILERLGEQHS